MSSLSSMSTAYISDVSPRVHTHLSRTKQEYNKKLSNFERDYDSTLSKIAARENALRTSMVAYTNRMRSIANNRDRVFEERHSPTEPLVVHAKHIPRFPTIQTTKRRPASLDELLGKQTTTKREKPRSASKISLPALPDRLHKRTHHVKISFVSASDLYDFVDFSIRNKDTKGEANSFRDDEDTLNKNKKLSPIKSQDSSNNDKCSKSRNIPSPADSSTVEPDTSDLSVVSTTKQKTKRKNLVTIRDGEGNVINESDDKTPIEETQENGDQSEVPIALDKLRIRPNRAKRMQLKQPPLNNIPEDDIIAQRSARGRREAVSPPPKQSPRTLHLSSQISLTAIPELETGSSSAEALLEKKRNKAKKLETNRQQRLLRTGAIAKLEPLMAESKSDPHPQLKTKMKAQKKFRRLIYLRDMPEQHYHRI